MCHPARPASAATYSIRKNRLSDRRPAFVFSSSDFFLRNFCESLSVNESANVTAWFSANLLWLYRAAACLVLTTVVVSHSAAAEEAEEPVSYHHEIEPILSRHCYGCHQGAKQQGGYVMTDFDRLLAGGESAQPAIVPGQPEQSHVLELITPVNGEAAMPAAPFAALSVAEVDLIRRWIEQGAVDDRPPQSGPRFSVDQPPVYHAPPAIASLDISPDATTLAVAGYHEVLLIDTAAGQTRHRLVGISPRINTVRFSPDGRRVAAVGGTPGERGEIQVWDTASGELLLSRLVTYDTLCGVSWSPQGDRLAFGAADNSLRAIDAETGQQVLFQGAHEDWVRDTAFTPDGAHLISVARDMTCKLTEVATERFVDNVTSITPGALSGGLNSVAAHPQRNEIVIGGADGIAKVYRVFRETERRIGDDANLIRNLPKLDGRIFAVAISPDGSRIAAAATLNGRSEVRVWQYDFDGALSDPIKQILAKQVAEWNAEERQAVEAYRNQSVTELARLQLPSATVFAVAIGSDQTVWLAASDGLLRRLDAAGQVTAEYAVVAGSEGADVATGSFDARAFAAARSESSAAAAADPAAHDPPADAPDPDGREFAAVTELRVEPTEIRWQSPYDYTQLVVTAVHADGSLRDVTADCRIQVPDWITATPSGLLRPAAEGSGSARVALGDHQQTIPVTAERITGSQAGAVDYLRDVAPVLSRLGCNAGTCHGAQQGRNGFRLSLRGYDAVEDLRALTDDLAARRINPAAPDESLMLRKPLGITPHQGGTLMAADDPNHAILRRWIADGSQLDPQSPRVASIEVFPQNPVVESTTARQQVRVVARYTDGSQRDVTHHAFLESGNTEVATVQDGGILSALRRGEAAVLVRYEGAYTATTLTVMGDRDGYQPVAVDAWNPIDEFVAAKWERMKIVPSDLCDDATFLRRVHLDLTGLPPTSAAVRAFLDDPRPTKLKRQEAIDQLIGSEAYIDYWTNKWADLLQVNRKFLGVEGSQAFREWIRNCVAENKPYDEFAREILTAAGSNHDNPPASYFKVLRNPEDTMENTTQLFLGVRFNCNKCHDHPFERWTQDQYYQLTAFFARTALSRDPASGDRQIAGTAVEGAKPLFEQVIDQDQGETMHPKSGKPVPPEFPFAVTHDAPDSPTRRQQLAAWMTDPDNPYFARSYVNRLWGYLLGVGLIEPIDDIRAGNPPTNPELLDHLTQRFIDSGFNVQQILREICNSRTYQLGVETHPLNQDDERNYSHAVPRRLPAEVIFDAVHRLTGAVSSIPGMPPGTRAAAVTDAGVKLADGFLQNLGRPARESACECERSSELQLGPVMALISGPTVGQAISDPGNELQSLVERYPDDDALAEELFLRALGRRPSTAELDAFRQSKALIQQNHQELTQRLAQAEQDWQQRLAELTAQRAQQRAETEQQISARSEAIQEQREQLAAEREARIKLRQEELANVEASALEQQLNQWQPLLGSAVEWFPLKPRQAQSNNKVQLTPLPDRSILASQAEDHSVYTITYPTSLAGITGFRLEAMTDAGLPNQGPGLPGNGNFVLSEIQLSVAPADQPEAAQGIRIASGKADYLQSGFQIEHVFDGNIDNATGWAVNPATGIEHWATFQLAEPIQTPGMKLLTFTLHQNHNAKQHLLGRFRISVTTAAGEIPLDFSERIATAASTAAEQRSPESTALLNAYAVRTSPAVSQAKQALAEARQPVPPDAELVALQQRAELLAQPIPDDPELVQLRRDVEQSAAQLQNLRLTAAEDLTWALVNSPAFLFNH